MTALKMTLRFTAAVLVLVLILAAIPGAVFATESARPTATEPDETQSPVTESPEEPQPRASGTTVTMKGDRIRQIQWIGQSEGRVDIRYTDALGNTHSGWITAITAYKADGVYAYCIEPSVEMASEYTDNAAAKAWAQQLTEGQRAAIAVALAVGYPSRDFPAADPPGVAGASFLEYPLRTDLWQISERYAATQIIIWEIVLGKRSAEPPYACTDKSLFESFYRARGKNPYGNRSDWETLKLTYDTISQSMADLNTIPSFTEGNEFDAPVYDLIFDEEMLCYTITLTDDNGILSQYDFATDIEGMTVTCIGNELTVTVTPEAAAELGGTFLLSADGTALEVDPDTVVAVWAPSGTGQTAVSLKADPIPVTAYFKLRAEVAGSLKIVKTSSSGNVSGFQFRVQGSEMDQTVTSDASGRILLENLEEGVYTITELLTDSSIWYCTGENPQTVTVEKGKTATVTFNNEKKQWRVSVSKEDRETGGAQADATLDGAVYGLYKDGVLVKEYTVKNGTFTTDAYDCGTSYTLKEISAPAGYQLDTTVYNLNDYSAPGKCSGALTTAQVTVLEDVITGQIEIIKRTLNPVSNETAPEPGAVFRYYLKSAGSYDACPSDQKGTMTTGTDGKARSKELPYGTYVAEQVSGAEGTDLVDSFEVVVSENGEVYSYTKDNPYWTGSVSIVKVEKGTTTPLVATFVLMDANKSILETVTTNDAGQAAFAAALVYGQTYYILETAAPDGYILDETLHPVTVTERNQAIVLTLENMPGEGSISVRKVDPHGNALDGVQFLLEYSTDGVTWAPVIGREPDSAMCQGGCTSLNLSEGTLTTDGTGMCTFQGLQVMGQTGPVFYRLTEWSTVNGSTLMLAPVFQGTIPVEGNRDISVTAVNAEAFELPHTGSAGMITVPFGVMMLSIAGWTVFYFAPKYRKKED